MNIFIINFQYEIRIITFGQPRYLRIFSVNVNLCESITTKKDTYSIRPQLQ